MLQPALLYKEELERKMTEIWYDLRYQYYQGYHGTSVLQLPDNNYDNHTFASVNSKGEVLGYISYSVDWVARLASYFGIVSFSKSSIIVASDIVQVVRDIFEKYRLHKMKWLCYEDNPARDAYERFVSMCGGRRCGYQREDTILMDGKYHDSINYEILEQEYFNSDFYKKMSAKSKKDVKLKHVALQCVPGTEDTIRVPELYKDDLRKFYENLRNTYTTMIVESHPCDKDNTDLIMAQMVGIKQALRLLHIDIDGLSSLAGDVDA